MTEVAVTCPVCKGALKSPIQLPCFHAYCRFCLPENSVDGTTSAQCVLCDVEFPDTTVGNIEPDEFLSKYMESVNDAVSSLGDRCTNCLGQPSQFCLDCKQCLCTSCSDVAHANNGTRHECSQIFNALDSMFKRRRQMLYTCKEHKEDMVFFCMTCSNLACMQCAIACHKRHWCVSIAEALNLKSDEIKLISDKLKNFVKTALSEINLVPQFYSSQIQRLKSETNSLFQSLCDIVTEKMAEINREIAMFEKTVFQETTDVRKVVTRLHSKACAARERLHLINRYGSSSDMLLHYSKIKSSGILREIQNAQDTSSLYDTRFCADDIEADLAKTLQKVHITKGKLFGARKNILLKIFLKTN